MSRVISYIDGFNLYFGLKDKGWKRYYWLDLEALSAALMLPDQQLAAIHYFTARLRLARNNQADKQRQDDYLDALLTRHSLHIHYGHYLRKNRTCRSCGASWPDYEEKMTDVNIAVQLIADAFDDNFDTALIISADSDLTTPVQMVRQRFPHKKIVIAQPPGRNSNQLSQAANGAFQISRKKLQQSQLPETITTAAGVTLQRPATWK
ncbi:NYN domain-containing protein [Stutzerimonas kunmingensis]|uniref:NYN domain-containing protein n=1 Tax=Stutzerimonas kunmingensis TaxID=1211807 RepID=UPI0028ACCA7C|nr:NYN domain-containing protein [Stutzerimonas kunmingensis]